MLSHATISERTYAEAMQIAADNGILMTNPSDGVYQIRHRTKGWLVSLYPRRKGASPRAYHDPNHSGPYAKLPEMWTLAQAVKAFAEAWNKADAGQGGGK